MADVPDYPFKSPGEWGLEGYTIEERIAEVVAKGLADEAGRLAALEKLVWSLSDPNFSGCPLNLNASRGVIDMLTQEALRRGTDIHEVVTVVFGLHALLMSLSETTPGGGRIIHVQVGDRLIGVVLETDPAEGPE
jgi:hypothetical protein